MAAGSSGPKLAVGLAVGAVALAAVATVVTLSRPSAPVPREAGSSGTASPLPPGASSRGPSPSMRRSPVPSPSPTVAVTPELTPSTVRSPRPATPGTATIPAFRHVYLIVMENKAYGSIVGSSAAPYLNDLIARFGLAARYEAVAHPSEPNYLALFSGSTQGVTDDGVHDLAGRNLADQLEAHGRTWRVFAENVPLGCFTGSVASGGPDGPGTYARKHEPAISFTDIARNPVRCRNITNLSHFDPAAADFELIVPNLCHDMHDCSVAVGDAFLRSFVPRITESAAFTDGVLFITWDEGTGGPGGGHVATIVVSPRVAPGTVSRVPHDHYSLLRTIEDAFGVGCLGRTCSANDLGEFFTR